VVCAAGGRFVRLCVAWQDGERLAGAGEDVRELSGSLEQPRSAVRGEVRACCPVWWLVVARCVRDGAGRGVRWNTGSVWW